MKAMVFLPLLTVNGPYCAHFLIFLFQSRRRVIVNLKITKTFTFTFYMFERGQTPDLRVAESVLVLYPTPSRIVFHTHSLKSGIGLMDFFCFWGYLLSLKVQGKGEAALLLLDRELSSKIEKSRYSVGPD